jgi:hypothetical protein
MVVEEHMPLIKEIGTGVQTGKEHVGNLNVQKLLQQKM